MPIPEALKQKYIARYDELIKEGHEVLYEIQRHEENARVEYVTSWGTKCASLLSETLPANHPRRAEIPRFGGVQNCLALAPYQMGQLQGLRDDFANGFLDSLSDQIEAAVAADYMGQAERLLGAGQSGSYDHVPAAVLAGAVLEKALRTLCERATPQISTVATTGKPLTLDPLFNALQKANTIKQTEAAQLKVWATIRNKAAHGEFEKFDKNEVGTMIRGITEFLARHL